jgi:CBS domain-containing protein
MRAGELCIRDVVIAERDESVVDAARRMTEFGVGDLVVVDGGGNGRARPIGIVTDRDLVAHALASGAPSLADLKVADVMSEELVMAVETDDIETVLSKLRQAGIRRIPVIDRRGYLQGIITLDDVIDWMSVQLAAATSAIARQTNRPDGAGAKRS